MYSLEVLVYKTTAVQPLASHLANRTSKSNKK